MEVDDYHSLDELAKDLSDAERRAFVDLLDLAENVWRN